MSLDQEKQIWKLEEHVRSLLMRVSALEKQMKKQAPDRRTINQARKDAGLPELPSYKPAK